MVASGFMIIWHLKSSSRNSNQLKFLLVLFLLLFLLNYAYRAFRISIYYSLTILNSFSPQFVPGWPKTKKLQESETMFSQVAAQSPLWWSAELQGVFLKDIFEARGKAQRKE